MSLLEELLEHWQQFEESKEAAKLKKLETPPERLSKRQKRELRTEWAGDVGTERVGSCHSLPEVGG